MIISKKYININDNKIEKIIKYSSLFICVAMTFLSCSCGDEEDSEDAIIDNNPNSGETNYSTTINSKVSATVYYSDYFWNISINTSLQSSDVDDNSIKYGIKCGYRNYPIIEYSKYLITSGAIITSKEPLFVDTPYATQAIYTNSYVALKQKMANGEKLSDSEQELYNNIIQDMRKNESSARSVYWGKIFVEIDGEIYYVKSF